MSTKDWKNKEIGTLSSEAWGFKFNSLDEFNEFNGEGELHAEVDDEELDERRTPHVSAKYKDEKDDDSTAKNAPPPPRVVNKGKMEEVEDEGETLDEAEDEEETLDEAEEDDELKHSGKVVVRRRAIRLMSTKKVLKKTPMPNSQKRTSTSMRVRTWVTMQ